jgi:hypothetical protein
MFRGFFLCSVRHYYWRRIHRCAISIGGILTAHWRERGVWAHQHDGWWAKWGMWTRTEPRIHTGTTLPGQWTWGSDRRCHGESYHDGREPHFSHDGRARRHLSTGYGHLPQRLETIRGAMLVRPRPMCPRPKILGCCIPWTKWPLANLPLTEPSHPFNLIERSDTRLPTAARLSATKRWSSMCGPSVHPTEGRQFNKTGQGRRRSRPDAPLIH